MNGWKKSWPPVVPISNGFMAEMIERLKLRVCDAEDLAVASACLQDAILPINDIAYLPDRQELVLVANRFCWSNPDHDGHDQRIHCGITIASVQRAQLRGIDLRRREQFLSLLALQLQAQDGTFFLTLECSGDRAIRLQLDRIDMRLDDMGDPWPASRRPGHPAQ